MCILTLSGRWNCRRTGFNPALEQANAVKAYLAEQNALNPQKKGTFTICTSGDPQVYVNVGKRLGLFEASELKVVHI